MDRFLKKYLKNASLSHIYRLIRKDVKVNEKRARVDTMLSEGDELSLYMSREQLQAFCRPKQGIAVKIQFGIACEDENILIAEKPFGLLTHGDAVEKKNTLSNQVLGYLQQKGEYHPGRERVFVPSPANRLDRNTTGLVIFGKNSNALRALNEMIRDKEQVGKLYLTIVAGEMDKPLILRDKMEKDEKNNRVRVQPLDAVGGKIMETIARPVAVKNGFSLIEVELVTGRTHQIRAHLGHAGYPVIGDAKYGSLKINQRVKQRFGLNTQLLHGYKLRFNGALPPLDYLAGSEVTARLPENFERIKMELFD